MTIAISILFIVFYAVADALADAFIFRWMRQGPLKGFRDAERHAVSNMASQAADYNTNWHRAQAAQQAAVLIATAHLSGHWPVGVLGAAIFWLLHDAIVNIVGLNRPFFFVGTTGAIDRALQRLFAPRANAASAVIKISFLVISVILLKIYLC